MAAVNLDGAKCIPIVADGYDPWFSEDEDEKNYAREVCNTCPAQTACLIHGLANRFEFGVFGGLDDFDRYHISDDMDNLPEGVVSQLQKYRISEEVVNFATPQVEAKYRRRYERAQFCMDQLIGHSNEIPRYEVYFDACTAVLDNPTGTGKVLGKSLGLSTATFNQYLRECFKYFNCDLSVL